VSREPIAAFFRIEELVVQVDVIRIYGREDRSKNGGGRMLRTN
jgi:hypothetical protein